MHAAVDPRVRASLNWPARAPAAASSCAGSGAIGARVAVVAIACLAAAALFGPPLLPYSPTAQLDITHLANASPSWAHPLGTDALSRDLLSRMLSGARVSLFVAALAVALSATLGTALRTSSPDTSAAQPMR